MTVNQYITEQEQREFCDKCQETICGRFCVIYRKASQRYDEQEKQNNEK